MLVARREERPSSGAASSWSAAAAQPQDLVALIGEAGVGKSRIAEWLCDEVHERGADGPAARPLRTNAAPLDGIIGAVNAHFGLEGADARHRSSRR